MNRQRCRSVATRLWLAGVFLGLLTPLLGQEPKKIELNPTEFKAATLSKILPYLRWSDADPQLIVGILGEDPAEAYLRHLLKGQRINGREVVIQTFKTPDEVGKCHLLFVPAAQIQQWSELHKRSTHAGLLTVGESADFIDKGGVFNLSIGDRKLEISRKNAKKAKVEIDSKLLKFCSQK